MKVEKCHTRNLTSLCRQGTRNAGNTHFAEGEGAKHCIDFNGDIGIYAAFARLT
jgi:hypothetical protein